MNFSSLVLFTILLFVGIQGGLIVLESVSSDYIGNLVYYSSVDSNNTKINASAPAQWAMLYLPYISPLSDPHLDVVYEGGNSSDMVYVNGLFVGNLTPASPDVISFPVSYLSLRTNVSYHFAGAVGKTNVTVTNLTYETYSGCNFEYESCNSMNSVRGITSAIMWLFQPTQLLLGGLIVLFAIMMMGGRK